MCGRFVGYRSLEELLDHFPIDATDCDVTASYNVAPGQEILAIARIDGAHVLGCYHWGLVPSWARETGDGSRMINARAETVASKPAFRAAFKKRRCLIPADGFYEWMGKKSERRPVYITRPDAAPFAFAGLWEVWHDPRQPDTDYRSCTIITRPAAGIMEQIHHRMPVILEPAVYGEWLHPDNTDIAQLAGMLDTAAVTALDYRPVSSQVNSARNDDPSNIRPIQTRLWEK